MEHFSLGTDLNKFENSLEYLISHIITVYLPGVLTICRIFGIWNDTSAQLKTSAIPIVSIAINETLQSKPLLAGIELGCNVFIVQHDAIISFMDQYIDRHDEATYRYSDRTVILLMDGTDSSNDEPNFLYRLSKHLNFVEIMNMLVLNPTANMEFIQLWTHRFVGTAEQSIDLLLLDTFDITYRTFRHGKKLFPDKTSNLQGKTIQLATFNLPPFIVLRKGGPSDSLVKSGNQMYEMNGLDGLLMMEFSRRYNCSVELVIDEVNMWGRIDPNKIGNGVLGNLAERRADVGLASLINWYEPLKFLTFSTPMQSLSVTCLTPKPILQPSWRAMLIVFSVPVWISTIVVFFILVLMYLLTDRLNQTMINQHNFFRNCLTLLAIFLQQAANLRKRNASDVILSLALLMFTFNIVNIYLSRNASLRTVPLFESSIDTLNKLAKSGLTLLQIHEAWISSMVLSENPTNKKLVSNFQAQPPPVLRGFADSGHFAFIIGRLEHGHLMHGEWITAGNVRKYQIMREDLYYDYEIAMATKTWPLMKQFSTLITRTVEAKLNHYQELDVIYRYGDYRVQTITRNFQTQESLAPSTMNLADLLGGFFLLGIGMLAASIVFAMEKLPSYLRK